MPAPQGSMLSLINSLEITESSQLSYKSICQWLSRSVSAVFYKLTEWDVGLGDPIFPRIKVLSTAPCTWLFKRLSELQLQVKLLWQISGECRRRIPMCALVNIANGNITAGRQTLSNQRENDRMWNSLQQLENPDWEATWENAVENVISHLHGCIICISLFEGAVCSYDGKHTEDGFILEEATPQLYWDLRPGWHCWRCLIFSPKEYLSHILVVSIHAHGLGLMCPCFELCVCKIPASAPIQWMWIIT